MQPTNYRLNPDAKFELIPPGELVAHSSRGSFGLSLSTYKLLTSFIRPQPLLAAATEHAAQASSAAIEEILHLAHERGLLLQVTAEPPGLESCLRPGLLRDEAERAAVAEALRAGRLVVLRDALDSRLADHVHRELDECQDFQPYEDWSRPFFGCRHHNLHDSARMPDVVTYCREQLGSSATKRFVTALSGAPCDGPLQFAASWYLPGDHSLPHTDFDESRSLAFVWHLTRDWQREWGGGLFWSPTGTTVLPSFNTLILFAVSQSSMHSVSVVSPRARSKRLALNGWWTNEARGQERAPLGDWASRPPSISLGSVEIF